MVGNPIPPAAAASAPLRRLRRAMVVSIRDPPLYLKSVDISPRSPGDKRVETTAGRNQLTRAKQVSLTRFA